MQSKREEKTKKQYQKPKFVIRGTVEDSTLQIPRPISP